jgi:hypothetical protein
MMAPTRPSRAQILPVDVGMTLNYVLYRACTRVRYWARYNSQQSLSKISTSQRVPLQSGIVLESLRANYQENPTKF